MRDSELQPRSTDSMQVMYRATGRCSYHEDDKAEALRAVMHKQTDVDLICETSYGIPGNWIGRKPENGSNQVQPNIEHSPRLTKTDVHAVAYSISPGARGLKDDLHVLECDTSKTIDTSGLDPKLHQGGMAVAFKVRGGCEGGGKGYLGSEDTAFTVSTLQDQHIFQPMMVRRLTPEECEALQGFPRGYTNIPWRNKPESPDGPRYKALGNSMAVNVMQWIGQRIQQVQEIP